jgi:hypothetical protein
MVKVSMNKNGPQMTNPLLNWASDEKPTFAPISSFSLYNELEQGTNNYD